ncbi:MAG: hypothetical protein E7255_10955 [Lachnospiraceae bacterium]|jgi:hypothetical protein|nr:hypothetical protein [Lachnospiraceae bacterium]
MKQLQLLFSNEVCLEDERKMQLDYCLTADYAQAGQPVPYYGIRITKHFENLEETEEVCGISYSKERVMSMIKKLFQYEVTPIHLVEIVDDFVTQGVLL